MLSLQYAYLLSILLAFIPWSILFLHRKDLRREMLVMGLFVGTGSIISAFFWTSDWWSPLTITQTRIGIEDFLLGFVVGGGGAVLYEEVFRKKYYKRETRKHGESLSIILVLTLAIFLVSFFIFNLSSFISSIMSFIFYSSILIFLRKDLFISSIANGLLVMLLSIPFYILLIVVFEGFADQTYPFSLSNVRILGVPIEEFIFWFMFGFSVIIFYEYWQGYRLRSLPRKK